MKDIKTHRKNILDWYDRHGRDLPWRYKNGTPASPYHVWLSEVMCQQTTIPAVKPYYERFLQKWPRVQDLAAATQDDVMREWAGLGYYARARNLHVCAKVIADEYSGQFPKTQAELKKLPGIGDYTSAAIAAIAFGEPATVMDGNIERVMARFFKIKDPLPKAKPVFKTYTAQFFDGFTTRPGDLAQALMDIGASICTPRNPKCTSCPIHADCEAYTLGRQEDFPIKSKTKARPHKYGEVYWITNTKGKVLFHKRPEKGLLGGMISLPTSEWSLNKNTYTRPGFLTGANLKAYKNQSIRHVFTHFDLTLKLKHVRLDALKTTNNETCFWAEPSQHADALPSLFKKAYALFHPQS